MCNTKVYPSVPHSLTTRPVDSTWDMTHCGMWHDSYSMWHVSMIYATQMCTCLCNADSSQNLWIPCETWVMWRVTWHIWCMTWLIWHISDCDMWWYVTWQTCTLSCCTYSRDHVTYQLFCTCLICDMTRLIYDMTYLICDLFDMCHDSFWYVTWLILYVTWLIRYVTWLIW